MQILDNGRLTDAKGRTVNFKNAIIIMTSNIGSEFAEAMGRLGFASGSEDTREKHESDLKEKIQDALERRFRPEFLNRLDEIIIFSPLSPAVIQKIVEVQLSRVEERMRGREIVVSFTPELKKVVAQRGYSPNYGARPLKRAIQSLILDPLAQEIIGGKVRAGDSVLVDAKNGEVVLERAAKRISGRQRLIAAR